eukprot:scaffold156029_cov43-Attheya_sp.AAC.1
MTMMLYLLVGSWMAVANGEVPMILQNMMMMAVQSKSLTSRSVEWGLKERGVRYIIGSDEVGRGCLAGPVMAASCCILTDNFEAYEPIDMLNDSKVLSPAKREAIYQHIVDRPDIYAWHVAERSHAQIDETNILKATMECFAESIEQLVKRYQLPVEGDDNENPNVSQSYCIVDGNKSPKLNVETLGGKLPCRPFVKADSQVYTVALASVIAKVTRDALLKETMHPLYPQYGFDRHKGYGTKDHIIAIHKHGPCPIHRLSFKPLKGR